MQTCLLIQCGLVSLLSYSYSSQNHQLIIISKVTGCSSGIGKYLALEIFNTTSHSIIATARNPTSLSYFPSSPRVFTLALDVTSQSSINAAVSSSLSTFKHIDILVNNAGYDVLGDTEFIPEEDARKMLETDFGGPVQSSKEAIRLFREVNGEKGEWGK